MFLLFDLDDTLHDKSASLAFCARRFQDEFSIDADPELFADAFVTHHQIIQPKDQVFNVLCHYFGLAAGMSAVLTKRFDATFFEDATLFPGALDALTELRGRGMKMGCVTNGRDFMQRAKIEALGLAPFFDVIITSGGYGVKKPDPAIFTAAMVALDAMATDCIFCGDNPRADIEPARALGMRTIWKSRSLDAVPAADFKMTTFRELTDIIDLIELG
jgi:putative hydrolase of the HAD superfamily